MSKQVHVFRPVIARRIPDPVFKNQHNTERHLFVMNVKDLPLNISTDPNARTPNINKQVYKVIEDSLLNRQEGANLNSFHLKNKGITIIADRVEQHGDREYKVHLGAEHGIVDGGHTYKLISDHIIEEDLPDQQFVNVEIRTGIQAEWIKDISGGLNTGVQVQLQSLLNLAQDFENIKRELSKHRFDKSIAWEENQDGDISAKDLVAIMQLFDIEHYPNEDGSHPISSYTSKESVLKKFKDNKVAYERLIPILKDILVLHDTISSTAGAMWNQPNGGKKGTGGKSGLLVWMEYRDKSANKSFQFPFLPKVTAQHRLMNSALYPILAAFRWYVVYDQSKDAMEWKVPFTDILQVWDNIGISLLRTSAEMCDDLGKNPNALGKSKPLWSNLHDKVKANALQRQMQ